MQESIFRGISMNVIRSALASLALALGCASYAQASNVALGKPVTLIGAFGTGSGYLTPPLPPVPPASIVTDGIIQSGYWTTGVWWDEDNSHVHSYVEVDLLGAFQIHELAVTADNNDRYLLEYRDAAGTWAEAWEVPNVCCFGLTTRTTTLATDIVATALRLSAFAPSAPGMDWAFSVSEVQALTVPEPATQWLGAFGLVAVAFYRAVATRRSSISAPSSTSPTAT